MSEGQELRLPPYFPRVPIPCKAVSATFFECFSAAADYTPGKDPRVARDALKKCKKEMEAYEACATTHLTAKQREIVQAPEVYLKQAKETS